MLAEVDARLASKRCLHPDAGPGRCTGGIIKAHTIQRGGGLDRIAVDGHVYAVKPHLKKLDQSGGLYIPERVGINEATTFTGFCQFHDHETFRPIEAAPLEAAPEHAFLLGYRAVCRELFCKQRQIEMIPFQRTLDRGKPLPFQVQYQAQLDAYEASSNAGLADIRRRKTEYDAVLLSGDHSSVEYYVVWFDSAPEVMCSGALAPEFDFAARELQGMSEFSDPHHDLDHLTFSLVGADSGGAAVFSWLGPRQACRGFAASLDALEDDRVPDALVRFCLAYFENFVVGPRWWDSLSEGTQTRLLALINSVALTPDWALDETLGAASWAVRTRDSNSVELGARPT